MRSTHAPNRTVTSALEELSAEREEDRRRISDVVSRRDDGISPFDRDPAGPLGEMSVLPAQVEFSEFKLGPRFSGDPNGASKLDWSVFTQAQRELAAAEVG